MSTAPDVLVMGEPLVELATPLPLEQADLVRLSCSGDALNAAAAAAAAGASVALVPPAGRATRWLRLPMFLMLRAG